jgi:hypothetical protein
MARSVELHAALLTQAYRRLFRDLTFLFATLRSSRVGWGDRVAFSHVKRRWHSTAIITKTDPRGCGAARDKPDLLDSGQ